MQHSRVRDEHKGTLVKSMVTDGRKKITTFCLGNIYCMASFHTLLTVEVLLEKVMRLGM